MEQTGLWKSDYSWKVNYAVSFLKAVKSRQNMTINTPDFSNSKPYLSPRGAGQDKNTGLCIISYSHTKIGWIRENWGLRSHWKHELSKVTTYALEQFPLLFQMQYKVQITICWNPKKMVL